jgi:hypothetical protein
MGAGRVLLPLLAVALLGAADPALDARSAVADALYLESGMGDQRGAIVLYQRVLDAPQGVPRETLAEACFRLGLAHERLDEPGLAEQAYEKLLVEHSGTSWSDDAQLRLRSLDEDRKQVQTLPVRFDFEDGLGGLYHARNRVPKGRIVHEQDGGQGVVAWRTYVIGGEDDIAAVGFHPSLTVQGEVGLRARARVFATHLAFFLVDQSGRRFGTTSRVLRPEDGWVTLELAPSDFVNRAGGTDGDVYSARAGIPFLMIQDVTGFSSTDRGENVILIDDLSVR